MFGAVSEGSALVGDWRRVGGVGPRTQYVEERIAAVVPWWP